MPSAEFLEKWLESFDEDTEDNTEDTEEEETDDSEDADEEVTEEAEEQAEETDAAEEEAEGQKGNTPENNPQAESDSKANEATETTKEDDQKEDLSAVAERILKEVRAIDPKIHSFADMEDPAYFATLIDHGMSVSDALHQSSPNLRKKESKAVLAASKSHMTSSISSEKKRSDDIDMNAVRMFMEATKTTDKKKAIAMYKAITKKK